VSSIRDIGPHYAVTLREWRAAWERKRGELLLLGYNDTFWRKYRSARHAFEYSTTNAGTGVNAQTIVSLL
jgi:cyclopropane fatty-acyl-phospholipid synthase-like methyltransferase